MEEGLTRLQYLDLIHSGYASIGQAMPAEFLAEYRELRAAEANRVARLEKLRAEALWAHISAQLNWKPSDDFKFTDVTNC
jgi:hypothetical protein